MGLPKILTHGAALARFARRSSAIKKLKNEKSAGCDNIPQEAIKAGGDTSEEVLLGLNNRIWSEEKIPGPRCIKQLKFM